jgi:hypothetical protein
MSTEQPSSPSPSEPISIDPQLTNVHEKLKEFGIDPSGLAICLIGQNEMLVGEVVNHQLLLADDVPVHGPLLPHPPSVVALKDPRRLTRHTMVDRSTNQIGNQLVFADFDFMNSGVIEVVPVAAFFLDWCDLQTQLNYCGAYANFMEGRRKAQAQASGIHIPDGTEKLPTNITDLIRKK